MFRALCSFALAGVCCLFLGCAICQAPYDHDYPVYGGGCRDGEPENTRLGSLAGVPTVSVSTPEPEGEEDLLPTPAN